MHAPLEICARCEPCRPRNTTRKHLLWLIRDIRAPSRRVPSMRRRVKQLARPLGKSANPPLTLLARPVRRLCYAIKTNQPLLYSNNADCPCPCYKHDSLSPFASFRRIPCCHASRHAPLLFLSPDGQDHELLHGQRVAGVAAAVDDVERGHRQDLRQAQAEQEAIESCVTVQGNCQRTGIRWTLPAGLSFTATQQAGASGWVHQHEQKPHMSAKLIPGLGVDQQCTQGVHEPRGRPRPQLPYVRPRVVPFNPLLTSLLLPARSAMCL